MSPVDRADSVTGMNFALGSYEKFQPGLQDEKGQRSWGQVLAPNLGNKANIEGAFHLGKKLGNFGGSKSGISDWSKVVPFGRKPRYVARCPTVDLELVQTTRNVNGTRHSVRKFQPGKRDHLFRFSTFSGNFPVE